ncbi:MAG: hypothetical protein ACKOB4_17830, partial [Acidobacteriota bacterium]
GGGGRGECEWAKKSKTLHMTNADAKFECDALARRELTAITRQQIGSTIDPAILGYTFQKSVTEYE